MNSFTVSGTMPSLNEYINAQRANRYGGNTLKQSYQSAVIGHIRAAKVKKCKGPVKIHYEHYVPNKRRDRDNIAAIVHKITQDALVVAGIIKDDGWDYVLNSFDEWHIDRKEPRIVVTIEEVGE